MGAEPPLTSTERSRRRRAALRARGLRPRTFWVPDVNSDAFKEQARRDCEAINAMRTRDEDIRFMESVQYWPDDDYDWGPGGPP